MTLIELGDKKFAKLGNPVKVVVSVAPSGSLGIANGKLIGTVGYEVPIKATGVLV